VAEFVLGRIDRSLRAPVRDGYLARFQNRLSDEARCVEAEDRVSFCHVERSAATKREA
jgi:hypothetical protein